MNDYIAIAVDFLSSADVYILAALAFLAGVKAITVLTKTKKDDEAVEKAESVLKKLLSFLPKKKEAKVESKNFKSLY